MSEMKQYKAGETIFREGDYETCMYRIVSGTVGIYRDLEGDEKKLLTELSDGRFFGEMGIIEYRPRTTNAEAVTDVEVEVFEDHEFSDFLENHTDEMFPVLDAICVRVRELTNDYEELCQDLSKYAEEENISADSGLLQSIMKFANLGKFFAKNK